MKVKFAPFLLPLLLLTTASVTALNAGRAFAAGALEIQVAEAPTDDLSLTVSAIAGARHTLLINAYELTAPEIAEAILSQITAGVKVQMLIEGQPVGGISKDQLAIESHLIAAMRAANVGDHLYEMKAPHLNLRRYRFDHAKYLVVDGTRLLVGSENYSPTGNPDTGVKGNRGWEIFIENPATAAQFSALFTADSNMSHGDIVDLTAAVDVTPYSPLPAARPLNQPTPPTVTAATVTVLTSPENSLAGLQRMIGASKTSIDVEQLTFDSYWKNSVRSPLIDALLAAAGRGVKIRVLLNDETSFSHPVNPEVESTSAPHNKPTIDLLTQAAKAGNLPIEARTANLRTMGVDYIHNKGMLIDQNQTLVSSINWDENSLSNNREAAVWVVSPTAHAHYEALFSQDWEASAP